MSLKTFRLLSLIVLFCLPLACNLPAYAPQASVDGAAPAGEGRNLLLSAPPGSTPTATPFQPLAPTPIWLPTDLPTPIPTDLPTPEPLQVAPEVSRNWADYPGPTIWPDIEVPAPTGILAHPEGQVNILLLGSDQRPIDGGLRTDTVILLTINPSDGSAHLTSFPRDLYVYIPGWTVQRINTAFAFGGFEALALTMEYNFGVAPDHYVMINLWSFMDVIDSLGGIDVEVGQTLCDHRDDHGDVCVYQGTEYMDGEEALWYVRSRYSTSDFDRGRRQQEVVLAVFNKLISMDGLSQVPELYNIYHDNVTTDMELGDMLGYLPLAAQVAAARDFERFYIGPHQVYDWINYSGAMVLMPVRSEVLDVMRQALNTP